MGTKILAGIAAFVLALILILSVGLLTAWAVMWLVNSVFTATAISVLFGAPKLTFWKAYALTVLFGILFNSSSSSSKKG